MPDYCNDSLLTTLVFAGKRTVEQMQVPAARPVDCFYVYPTVSNERRQNSDLRIQVDEKAVALAEAAPFERVCRVFAPMYHQVTAVAVHGNYELEYRDVVAAWHDYLAHYNDGRGVVLIGHSEGSFILKRLIRDEVERTRERRLLVSAILVGGDVVVAAGAQTGGDFRSTPACRSRTQTGCVIAYSTWDRTPPKDAAFEDVGSPHQQVLCVNPAAPGATGAVPITPLFSQVEPEGIITAPLDPPVQTLWIGFPGLYTARCVVQGQRAWLLVRPISKTRGGRPLVQEILQPSWGLHAADIDIALENLVALVRLQVHAWLAHH